MVAPLDVFELGYYETNWLGCVNTLREALDLAKNRGRGNYCVFSQKAHEKDYYEVTTTGEARGCRARLR